MPVVAADDHQILLFEQIILSVDHVVQLPLVHIHHLIRLVAFAAEIKVACAFLIEKRIQLFARHLRQIGVQRLRAHERYRLGRRVVRQEEADRTRIAQRDDGKAHARMQRDAPVEIERLRVLRILRVVEHQQRHSALIVQDPCPVRLIAADLLAALKGERLLEHPLFLFRSV